MTLSSLFPSKNYWYVAFIAFIILTIGLILLHNVTPVKRDYVASGFLIDIIVTFPVVYYFLLVRPLNLKKWRMVLVFTCCCTVAYIILPSHQQYYIIQLRKLTVSLELGVIIYGLSKIKKIRAVYNQMQADFPDVAYNLHKSMTDVLGNGIAIKFVASELTILNFGLFWWKKQKAFSKTTNQYSVYKESGYAVLFSVILVVCLIELVALHLLLMHYSNTAATILTVISIYGTIFIIGDFSAIIKCPVMILENQVLLHTGLRWRVLIKTTDIATVEKIKEDFQSDESCFKGGVTKNSINVLFTFKNPVIVQRLYKKPIIVKQIAMSIDQVDSLITQLNTGNLS